MVKLGLLYRHSQFSADELSSFACRLFMLFESCLLFFLKGVSTSLRSKFKMAVLTLLSYHDVAFTYDGPFILNLLDQCKVGGVLGFVVGGVEMRGGCRA